MPCLARHFEFTLLLAAGFVILYLLLLCLEAAYFAWGLKRVGAVLEVLVQSSLSGLASLEFQVSAAILCACVLAADGASSVSR